MLVARTPEAAKVYAIKQLHNYNWNTPKQKACLLELWRRESNWRPNALNKQPVKVLDNGKWVSVYAGGIPQILGLDRKLSVEKQITAGLTYIQTRYQNPCNALRHHDRVNWY